MERKTYSLLENYMLSCSEDSAHDAQHIYRVLYTAMEIARTEQEVDYDVLIAACLLHDIGRREQFEDPRLNHAAVGGEKAYAFLTEQGFPEEFAGKVRECILAHSYRKGSPPQSLEAKILFDADKIDTAGAIGLARALIYKGQVGEPLYTLKPDGSVSDGQGDEAPSLFQEYKYKLEKLYDRFFTKHGQEIARKRQANAVRFYEDLLEEVRAPYEVGRNDLEALLR